MAQQGGFKSEREKQKWEKIQATGSKTIDAMLKGAATPEDLKSLSRLVAEQHSMAGRIFDEGVASAEKTADAIIDKMNADRIAVGKPPLTQKAHERTFRRTFQEVLSASTEDILGTIKDMLEEGFVDQQETTKKLIDDAFVRLRNLTQPTNTSEAEKAGGAVQDKRPSLPTTPIGFAQQKLVTKPESAAANQESYSGSSDTKFMAKLNQLTTSLKSIAASLAADVKSGKALTDFKNFFTEDNPPPGEAGKHSIMTGLRRIIKAKEKAHTLDDGDKEEDIFNDKKSDFAEKFLSLIGMSKKELIKRKKEKERKRNTAILATSTPAESLAQHLEFREVKRKAELVQSATKGYDSMTPEDKQKTTLDKEIEKAIKDNEKLKQKTIAEWGKIEQARADYDEDKKAESWIRKLKATFGEGHKKESGGWVSALLGGAALLLTNPQLISNITDAISKYLNFQTISKFIEDTWDSIKEGGTKVLSWIVDEVKDFANVQKHKVEGQEDSIEKVQKVADAAVSKATIAPDTTVEQAKKAIPMEEAALKSAQDQLIAAHHGLLNHPDGDEYYKYKNDAATAKANVDIHTKKLRMYKDVVSGKVKPQAPTATPSSTMGSNPASAAGLTGGSPSVASTNAGSSSGGVVAASSTQTASPTASSATSQGVLPSSTTVVSGNKTAPTTSGAAPGMTPSAPAPQQSSTQIVPAEKATYQQGRAVESTPTQIPAQTPTSNGNAGNASSAIGLNTFGFNSGDDTLNVYNLRMMS